MHSGWVRTVGDMQTVPATPDDAEGIAVAHVLAWQDAYRGMVADAFLDAMRVQDGAARWRSIIQDPECAVLVAKSEGKVHGFVSFGRHREPGSKPAEGEIWTLYVHPHSWRGGVGRQLISHALATLASQAFLSTWVWILAENHRAQAFYKACGFSLVPTTHRHFQLAGQSLPEVAMVRVADPSRAHVATIAGQQ